MNVRPYAPADRDALVALMVEMDRHYEGDGGEDAEEIGRHFDHAHATLTDTLFLVAEASLNGGPALHGYLTAVRTFPGNSFRIAWWVKEVYVAAAGRGSGVGTALMEAFLAHVRLTDGERVDVTTDRTNAAAIGLYESLGGKMTDKVLIRYDAEHRPGPAPREGDIHA
ncbi:MAG: GNAT family N-acetyltransferase [Pseudomonadota bacterium]